MLPSEHSMLNHLLGKPGSVRPQYHRFLHSLDRFRARYPYCPLSTRQRAVLRRLYDELVKQGLAEAVG